jgi:glutamine cyclotransferase
MKHEVETFFVQGYNIENGKEIYYSTSETADSHLNQYNLYTPP